MSERIKQTGRQSGFQSYVKETDRQKVYLEFKVMPKRDRQTHRRIGTQTDRDRETERERKTNRQTIWIFKLCQGERDRQIERVFGFYSYVKARERETET